MREFVIYRCHDDGHKVVRFEVKRTRAHTALTAYWWVENEQRSNPFKSVWFEVEENLEYSAT